MGTEMISLAKSVRSHDHLPCEVKLLLRREREIASIVYSLGTATANDVLEHLSAPLANASVRSMLSRLVAKGILQRRRLNRAYVYAPAISSSDSRRLALIRFTDDYFAGSIERAAATIERLVGARRRPSHVAARQRDAP